MNRNIARVACAMMLGATAVGCQKASGEKQADPRSAAPESAAGIAWTPPAGWTKQGPRPMRIATYTIPRATGDSEDGQCTVHFFGAGQGGDVEANLRRWYEQMQQPDGRPSSEVARRAERTVAGIAVTRVDIPGTFLFSPAPMSPHKTPKPDFRMIGAIAQAPEGNVFFKLVAPAKTAEQAAAAFETMLGSIVAR